MSMTLFISSSLNPTALFALFFFLSFSCCLSHDQPPDTTYRGLVVAAEKARLGSTPPSCHNKCNQCHPCMAVQVPTMPGHDRVEPGREEPAYYFDAPPAPPSSAGNRYSNYKPLGWKCRCDGHFYNP